MLTDEDPAPRTAWFERAAGVSCRWVAKEGAQGEWLHAGTASSVDARGEGVWLLSSPVGDAVPIVAPHALRDVAHEHVR